ncbi:hypothetical protein MUN84_17870 [Hymenobacter sp. 5516J-16]|uniref:DUF6970 domain-containing protein n=1 Tax=Hymenobacter sp. 5516J-16 TaxID=2932253 RepID=UPI001FD62745|nr:hypothetical protein [Hymenobacter sp. 5516J-16]UOQ76403.1 hypothetical protein MUN84_17870 [Hymenobacter sp. 5516J-16]
MKKTFYLLLAPALLCTACDETDIEKGTPSCIRQKTINLERESPCEEGAYVKEYLFQGKTVFVFEPGNCIADGSAEVVDEGCNRLGYLGGFIGNTRINGQDFSTAEFKRTIWEKK